jgi:glycosyltransferase involved in cell wall biosynthesis
MNRKAPIKVVGFALYGPLAASHRVRLSQYKTGLLEYGIDLHVQALLDDAYVKRRFEGRPISGFALLRCFVDRFVSLMHDKEWDLFIIHCELFPLLPARLERYLVQKPYIYDFDDAFYLRYRTGKFKLLRPILGDKFDHVISSAKAVTAGSEFLAKYAEKFNTNTFVLPSVVNTDIYRYRKKDDGTFFTIGWIGSPSTAPYLEELIDPLSKLSSIIKLRLVVVGGKAPRIQNVEVSEQQWDSITETDTISSFDVGVMPLPDTEWARGKCAYKIVQYMACGVPVVASKVGANLEVLTESCGYLVTGSTEWYSALLELYENSGLRYEKGQAALARARSFYSLESNLPKMAKVIKSSVQ